MDKFKLTDRNLAWLGVIVAGVALWYGYKAGGQNREIISHTKDLKARLGV